MFYTLFQKTKKAWAIDWVPKHYETGCADRTVIKPWNEGCRMLAIGVNITKQSLFHFRDDKKPNYRCHYGFIRLWFWWRSVPTTVWKEVVIPMHCFCANKHTIGKKSSWTNNRTKKVWTETDCCNQMLQTHKSGRWKIEIRIRMAENSWKVDYRKAKCVISFPSPKD